MSVAAKSDLPRLLRSIRDRFASTASLAEAIGITGSRLGRAMKGQNALNELNCLRLAVASGESPTLILRAAGKGAVADLIEQLYGDGATAIPAKERRTLAQLQSVPKAQRAALERLIDELALAQPSGGARRGHRPSA